MAVPLEEADTKRTSQIQLPLLEGVCELRRHENQICCQLHGGGLV